MTNNSCRFNLIIVTAVLVFAVSFGVVSGFASRTGQPQTPSQEKAQGPNAGDRTAAPASEAFERLKKLEGKWMGRSTKGWEESITFKTIAKGSVVHESSFDAHPNETMATMYYLDGGRLLLTHFCVSKTQPRLQATDFDEGGRKVTFTSLMRPTSRPATKGIWTRSLSTS